MVSKYSAANHIWARVFKNVPSKICGRLPLKKLKYIKFAQQIN